MDRFAILRGDSLPPEPKIKGQNFHYGIDLGDEFNNAYITIYYKDPDGKIQWNHCEEMVIENTKDMADWILSLDKSRPLFNGLANTDSGRLIFLMDYFRHVLHRSVNIYGIDYSEHLEKGTNLRMKEDFLKGAFYSDPDKLNTRFKKSMQLAYLSIQGIK